MSYKVEIVERKVPIVQLEVSKSSIKDFFSNLLNETKGFMYQITVKFLLNINININGEIEFAPAYFNSVTKTVINHRFRLENSFHEILYMIDVWINKESGSTYRPLSRSSYMDLPVELKSPRKGLINIKNKDQKCFLWCHVRHINPSKEHPERIRKIDEKLVKHITNPEEITEKDKEFVSDLDYDGIKFPV